MFTRISDDRARMEAQNRTQTFIGRYQLNTPGCPSDSFSEDPNIRLQGWGANLQGNTTDLESEFRGLGRHLNHDRLHYNDYNNHKTQTIPRSYGTQQPFVEESRATDPAWMYRGVENTRTFCPSQRPFLNPQALSRIEFAMPSNINSTLIAKDAFYPGI